MTVRNYPVKIIFIIFSLFVTTIVSGSSAHLDAHPPQPQYMEPGPLELVSFNIFAEGFGNNPVSGNHQWGTSGKIFGEYNSNGFFVVSPSTIPETELNNRSMFLNLNYMDYLFWWSMPSDSLGFIFIKVPDDSVDVNSFRLWQNPQNPVNRILSATQISNNQVIIVYDLYSSAIDYPLHFWLAWDVNTDS